MRSDILTGGYHKPFARARLIPRCANCLMANPRDLDECENCGNALPRMTEVSADVIDGGMVLRIGMGLMRVGAWLAGKAARL